MPAMIQNLIAYFEFVLVCPYFQFQVWKLIWHLLLPFLLASCLRIATRSIFQQAFVSGCFISCVRLICININWRSNNSPLWTGRRVINDMICAMILNYMCFVQWIVVMIWYVFRIWMVIDNSGFEKLLVPWGSKNLSSA